VARLDAELPVTREELEATLRQEGFVQQHGSSGGSVWWSQDRTKFVCFPDDTSGEAIYGDSEIGEPGKTVPIAVAGRVVRGELLLDSPLGVMPAQQREPAVLAAPRTVRALGWNEAQIKQELAPWPEEKAPRGLTADDPLPALPAHLDRNTWFIDPPTRMDNTQPEAPHSLMPMRAPSRWRQPESDSRHETLRPPPSDRPAQTVVPTARAFNLDEPTRNWARLYRVSAKLRWVAAAAAPTFFIALFLPTGHLRTFLAHTSFGLLVGVIGIHLTLIVRAWRSRNNT
jgi:hypothetical protein